jgi:hypothetical protein
VGMLGWSPASYLPFEEGALRFKSLFGYLKGL